ncbi:MAG: hypothetical protein ABSH46_12230 [Bryobacteraceae bacterium]|jgi:hypothetical protein
MKVVLCPSLAMPLLLVSVLAAGQPKQAPPAPVPAQILTAKRVFVVNAGADGGSYPDAPFSGEPDRAYNSFYAAMKASGHYELVGAPSDADLLFEIRFTVRPGWVQRAETAYWDAQFRLVIRDPKSHTKLWALTEQVEKALLQGNRDKNFDQALTRMVSDVQKLTAPSAAANSNSQ